MAVNVSRIGKQGAKGFDQLSLVLRRQRARCRQKIPGFSKGLERLGHLRHGTLECAEGRTRVMLGLQDGGAASLRVPSVHSAVRAGAESLEPHAKLCPDEIPGEILEIGWREIGEGVSRHPRALVPRGR